MAFAFASEPAMNLLHGVYCRVSLLLCFAAEQAMLRRSADNSLHRKSAAVQSQE
jgi:hypothetical protein